ncbi:hypothetical protein HMPREF9018_1249 [Prevotella amnii CRIS 21A-A]|uniref:Uncharacterized protein n=1 Tax=Prevotella amnii CRIS 21A-A TaxID=679191 RepID=E1GXD7_9BACT|nr:hypothetical protein HMPREF9018_1249 [Prevotella amnii CRIS 21A-A]
MIIEYNIYRFFAVLAFVAKEIKKTCLLGVLIILLMVCKHNCSEI